MSRLIKFIYLLFVQLHTRLRCHYIARPSLTPFILSCLFFLLPPSWRTTFFCVTASFDDAFPYSCHAPRSNIQESSRACYNIRESSHACYIMHNNTCYNIRETSRAYILCIMHVISFGRALVHVISCIMHLITFERPLVYVISFGRALVHVISCMMHVITFGRTLVHVVSCIMHVITLGRALVQYIMHHAC